MCEFCPILLDEDQVLDFCDDCWPPSCEWCKCSCRCHHGVVPSPEVVEGLAYLFYGLVQESPTSMVCNSCQDEPEEPPDLLELVSDGDEEADSFAFSPDSCCLPETEPSTTKGRARARNSPWLANLCAYGFAIFWLIVARSLALGEAVICRTCWDQIEGCAGGAACLFATRTAANAGGIAAAGGAAITVASLLPLAYIRHLPAQVLCHNETLQCNVV